MKPPNVLVVIPVHGQLDCLAQCLASLDADAAETPYDLLLVDDATPGGLRGVPDRLRGGRRRVSVLTRPVQGGFTAAVNDGLRTAAAGGHDATVLLNSDMEVLPGWLDALVARWRTSGAGLVGGMELAPSDPDCIVCGGNRPIFGGGELTSLLRLDRCGSRRAGEWQTAERLEWVSFGIVLISRRAHAALGDLDGRFRNYFSDADYGMRANLAGFSVWYEPAARVLHHRHQTTRLADGGAGFMRLQEERERFCRKWLPGGLLLGRDVRRWVRQGTRRRLPWRPRLIPHLAAPPPLGPRLRSRLIADESVRRDVTLAAAGGAAGTLDAEPLAAFRRLYARRLAFADFTSPAAAGWSMADPWQGLPVLVLAPHCDDAALSVGGLLLAGAGRAGSTHVHVLFGRSSHAIGPLAGLDCATVSRLRELEEAAFCAHAGAALSIDPAPDRLLRHPGRPILLGSAAEVESAVAGELTAALRAVLAAYRTRGMQPLVLAPLAAGLMADHAAVAVAAATLVAAGEIPAERLLVYDDLPYAGTPGAVHDGLELYRRCGFRLLPRAIDIAPWFDQKCELLALYASQLDDEALGAVERYGQAPLDRLAGAAAAAGGGAAMAGGSMDGPDGAAGSAPPDGGRCERLWSVAA